MNAFKDALGINTESNTMTKVIGLCCTDDEYQYITTLAESSGMSATRFLRKFVLLGMEAEKRRREADADPLFSNSVT